MDLSKYSLAFAIHLRCFVLAYREQVVHYSTTVGGAQDKKEDFSILAPDLLQKVTEPHATGLGVHLFNWQL